MESRAVLTKEQKQIILNKYIQPYLQDPVHIMDLNRFMDLLQYTYAIMQEKKEEDPQKDAHYSHWIAESIASENLGRLFLDKTFQQKNFPGISLAEIQSFIRESLLIPHLSNELQRFMLDHIKENMIAKTTPLYYALGDPLLFAPAMGARELEPYFNTVNTRKLLESFPKNPEQSVELFKSFYEVMEASLAMFKSGGKKHSLPSIWVVCCFETLRWDPHEAVVDISNGKIVASGTYAVNPRPVFYHSARVNVSSLQVIAGFALGQEQNFKNVWLLGSIEKEVLLQYFANPTTLKTEEENKRSGCRLI